MVTETGTLSTKGQVTVPKAIRDALGLIPGDKVRFDLQAGDKAVVQKAEPSKLTEILARLGPMKESGLSHQRRVRHEWTSRARRH